MVSEHRTVGQRHCSRNRDPGRWPGASLEILNLQGWGQAIRSTGDLDVVDVRFGAPVGTDKPDAHQQVGNVVATGGGGVPALGDNSVPASVTPGSPGVVVADQKPSRAPVRADLGDLVAASPDCGGAERIPGGESAVVVRTYIGKAVRTQVEGDTRIARPQHYARGGVRHCLATGGNGVERRTAG